MMTPKQAGMKYSVDSTPKGRPGRAAGARKIGASRICLLAASIFASASLRAEEPTIAVKIVNHHFIPAEVEIPAGEKCLLVIENQDPTVEEFESHSLHREKIIAPHAKASVYVGPLKPGRYEFQGEFNETTAKGAVVAK